MEYNFREIEKKWQDYWEKNKTFKASEDPSFPEDKRLYVLDMFPYPSGSGLHVGHPEGYTATDIFSRYKRMCGYNVLHPMGWDAFGLPAEQYAIQTGTHPAITTKKNCDTFRQQIKSLGLSYDWDREINTTDPKYYKWTQWIFIRLYNTWFDEKLQKGRPIEELEIPEEIQQQGKEAIRKYIDSKRLAYYDDALVWWCDTCKIVCANEEILNDGTHEKCGTKNVYRKKLKQWLLRITHYAERLLKGLDTLTEWPESIKEMQRNWIGKSTGAEVDFKIDGLNKNLTVFTTRPDTLFGATYMVISPEHPMVDEITLPEYKEQVNKYIKEASLKSDLDRTDLSKEKTGVFTGRYAINPVNDEKIPIWVADYVLMGYGTGAIMAVPAHDTRDFEFAKKYNLPIRAIMIPETDDEDLKNKVLNGDACWTEDGIYFNSSNHSKNLSINGLKKAEGIKKIIEWLEKNNLGKQKINYKLRDWLFSRQRYWGEPFPIIHWEDGEISVVKDEDLPVELPPIDKFQPSENGESPLANATEWLNVVDHEGKYGVKGRKGKREINTMPQWAGSCWYYLRFIDPHNDKEPFSKDKEKYWMPVDLYVGGAEHAVLHLLYSRFWHKVLYDLGIVSTDEPFKKLFNQGMILAYAYETKNGSKVPVDEVEERNGKFYSKITGEELNQIIAKMSKTLKNVVNPDDVVKEYGADSLRCYEMFMGPLEATKPWNDAGLKGVFNFLQRTFKFFSDLNNIKTDIEEEEDTLKILHQTIKKIRNDIENLRFNTAIAQMMIFTNHCLKKGFVTKHTAEAFIKCLSPFAPHLAEEIWQIYGHNNTLAYEPFPDYNEEYLKEDYFEYPVSFNGKLRFKIKLPVDMSEEEIKKTILSYDLSQKWIANKEVKNIIVVKNKIINVVV